MYLGSFKGGKMSEYDKALLQSFGKDVFISANVEIRRPQLVSIGNHVTIDSGFYLTTKLSIGNYCHIGPQVSVIGGAKGLLLIGHFTSIAAGTRLVCVSDTFSGEALVSAPGIPEEFVQLKVAPIVLEDFVNIGSNVVVHPGVTLAEGSVIGSGAVVTKSTEPWTVYGGIPARPLKIRAFKRMCEYADKLGYPFV
jgi:acetyltransferase-like isoleucine patch superfamily enzyme